jgi:CDP-diacylglycerol--serine O-phosphatidyltransferase
VLSIGTVAFLAGLPFGWLSYQDHLRKDAQAAAGTDGAGTVAAGPHAAEAVPDPETPAQDRPDDRPARLN